jgi:HSP20 family protein
MQFFVLHLLKYFPEEENSAMAQNVSKVPVTQGKSSVSSSAAQPWQPIESLHREIDRLFEDFGRGLWQPFRPSMFAAEPLWGHEMAWGAAAPAVDVTESEKAYEITAELPGMDEKKIEVKVADGGLTIKGEKQEEKEEKKKNYYLHERHFGSFERCFGLPEGVDTNKIEAAFNKGVLRVTLPKKPEAQKPVKKIDVKAA